MVLTIWGCSWFWMKPNVAIRPEKLTSHVMRWHCLDPHINCVLLLNGDQNLSSLSCQKTWHQATGSTCYVMSARAAWKGAVIGWSFDRLDVSHTAKHILNGELSLLESVPRKQSKRQRKLLSVNRNKINYKKHKEIGQRKYQMFVFQQ
jgi:hypothetical protein